MVFRLEEFDDFVDCAKGCLYVFFMKHQVRDGVKIVAHAGRVYWSGVLKDERAQRAEDELRSLGAKQILEDVPPEQVFR
ncbi:MAG: hypothetical protein JRN62_06020 [Nitrososphaerota archaeon]|jgi:hypothetical protein|nr:hypothetical protein [Nitrososphaerota archaeon]